MIAHSKSVLAILGTDAVILDALIVETPASDLIPKVVAGLMNGRTNGRWSNTQENVFVLLAMDRYFNTYEATTPDFVARMWLGETYVAEHAPDGKRGFATSWIHGWPAGHSAPAIAPSETPSAPQRTRPLAPIRCTRASHAPAVSGCRHAKIAASPFDGSATRLRTRTLELGGTD